MPVLGPKAREGRRTVSIAASLRSEAPRCEVVIRNVSARGMTLLVRGTPPRRGSFVDIRRGPLTLTGQVRWCEGDRIGVRLQDRIDPAALVRPADPAGQPDRATPVTASMAITASGQRHRERAALLQSAALVGVPSAVVLGLAWTLWNKAAAPLRAIAGALG